MHELHPSLGLFIWWVAEVVMRRDGECLFAASDRSASLLKHVFPALVHIQEMNRWLCGFCCKSQF
jgi:hypothetical protein